MFLTRVAPSGALNDEGQLMRLWLRMIGMKWIQSQHYRVGLDFELVARGENWLLTPP